MSWRVPSSPGPPRTGCSRRPAPAWAAARGRRPFGSSWAFWREAGTPEGRGDLEQRNTKLVIWWQRIIHRRIFVKYSWYQDSFNGRSNHFSESLKLLLIDLSWFVHFGEKKTCTFREIKLQKLEDYTFSDFWAWQMKRTVPSNKHCIVGAGSHGRTNWSLKYWAGQECLVLTPAFAFQAVTQPGQLTTEVFQIFQEFQWFFWRWRANRVYKWKGGVCLNHLCDLIYCPDLHFVATLPKLFWKPDLQISLRGQSPVQYPGRPRGS